MLSRAGLRFNTPDQEDRSGAVCAAIFVSFHGTVSSPIGMAFGATLRVIPYDKLQCLTERLAEAPRESKWHTNRLVLSKHWPKQC